MSFSQSRNRSTSHSAQDVYSDPNTRITVARVSSAKLFEPYRMVPKFRHVPQAVINPIHRHGRNIVQSRSQNLEIDADSIKVKPRQTSVRDIP